MHPAPLLMHQFVYHSGLLQVGTVYHYIKSNHDGSNPARVSIYLATPEEIEVLKLEAHGLDAAYVRAHMNWQVFCADQLESWVIGADGQHRPMAKFTLDCAAQRAHISVNGRAEMLTVNHLPAHIYNFDFISLNLALRYWQQPEGALEIGILQPNFDPHIDALMRDEGLATLRFVAHEQRHGKTCRRYNIDGAGLHQRGGTIWVNQTHGHIEDMAIALPDNPAWHNFKFQWVRTDLPGQIDWQTFITQAIADLKTT